MYGANVLEKSNQLRLVKAVPSKYILPLELFHSVIRSPELKPKVVNHNVNASVKMTRCYTRVQIK